jgi:proteasome assembly chaperone (PAC2) family protein
VGGIEVFSDLPELVDPVMVAGFEGWNDAGEAATAAIDHLADLWDAGTIAEVDPEEFYDYQVNRPMITVDDTGVRRLEWPSTTISVARAPAAPRDIVLVRGIEPNMRWKGFVAEILGWAAELGVEQVLTLGALMADTPHTRPVPISGTSTDAALRARLGLETSRYEGPTGIVGVLQEACDRAGIPAISLWAAVPHYVAQPPHPKATLALLRRIEDVLDVAIPTGDLTDEARAWQAGVDELAEEDEEVSAYVRQLEEQQDTTELPEASGEAIAREFERYLRRRPDEA